MKTEIVVGLAATGVFLSASPIAESTLTTHEKITPLSEDQLQRQSTLGNLAVGHSFRSDPSPTDIAPIVDWRTDPHIPPAKRKELARQDAYMKKVLVPLVEKDPALDVIQPVNTQADPVNGPGEILVVDAENKSCVSQVYVELSGEDNTHSIYVSTWGKRKYYDGTIYGQAAYTHGMLSHAEGADNFGREYPSDEPEDAVDIIGNITDTKCPTQNK